MNDNEMMSASHAVSSLRLHIVLVTKYRRKTLTPVLLDALQNTFVEILTDWRCTLIEFGGEADHVHLLVGIHPALNISTLINNLKSASSRRMRNRFARHLAKLLATVFLAPRVLRRQCRRRFLGYREALCRGPRDDRKTPQGGPKAAARLTPSRLRPGRGMRGHDVQDD